MASRKLSVQEAVDFNRRKHRAHWIAGNHHRTHENKAFDLKLTPYIEAFLYDESQLICGMKSTQGGWTEAMLIKALAKMEDGLDLFWVMPTEAVKSRFVRNRFDRSIAYTEWYQQYIGREETRVSIFNRAASMSLKHYAGSAVAFIGSNSQSGFGEFPADVLVVDEYDYCDQDKLLMAEERLSRSEHRMKWLIGNPTIEGRGIANIYYRQSDQCRWVIQGDCGHWIRPEWTKHVVREVEDKVFEARDPEWCGVTGPDARLICDVCGKPVNRFGQGAWTQEKPGALYRGYHVSKLFSTRMPINEIMARFDNGMTNPEALQRFWNGDMGEPFKAKGATVDLEDLRACVKQYSPGHATKGVFVGIDVGSVLHIAIGENTNEGGVRVVSLMTVQGEFDLKDLKLALARYNVLAGVIDELPETRLARRLSYSNRRWLMCRYGDSRRDSIDQRARVVTVMRTASLDAVVEMISLQSIQFPMDAMAVPGFADHMRELTRVYNPDTNHGEGAYEWIGGGPDHYFHAIGYMLTARRIAMRRLQ